MGKQSERLRTALRLKDRISRVTQEVRHYRAHARKRCDGSTLRDAIKIGPPVVLEEGRQRDANGVGI